MTRKTSVFLNFLHKMVIIISFLKIILRILSKKSYQPRFKNNNHSRPFDSFLVVYLRVLVPNIHYIYYNDPIAYL